jgi:hypothetical protein
LHKPPPPLDPSQPAGEAMSACVSDRESALQPAEVRMMLIAGGDLRAMEETAVAVYRAGHIPILSEWLSSPLASVGDPSATPDAEFTELTHPIAERLLARCDAVVRVDGHAAGADLMVALARQRGIRVYQDLTDALAG